MHILKMGLGIVMTIVALIIAGKLLLLIMGLVSLVMKLVWLAVIVGLICLVGWVIYKLISPGRAEPA